VGKSSIATRLALRLGITRIVTTDTIREVLRTVVPASVLPELHVSSPRLITPASPDPYAGFDRQAHAVGGATRAVADRLAVEQRSCVVEGVHLLPGRLGIDLAAHPARPIVVERMLVEPDPQIHYHRLLRRSEQEPRRGGRQGLDGFDRVRAIQEHLAAMAADRGIPVVEPGGFGELTQTIVGEIVRRTEERDLPGAA
jgi:2-phosphoglycerate kinase